MYSLISEVPKSSYREVLLLVLIAFVFGCATSSPARQIDIEALVQSKLGTSYSVTENASRQYALYQQTPANDHAFRSYKYVIIRLSDGSVSAEGSFRNGSAKWIDNYSVEVISTDRNEKTDKKIIRLEDQNGA